MAQAKRIYILMTKWASYFLFYCWNFLKKMKACYSYFFVLEIKMHVEVQENLKKLWKHSPVSLCSYTYTVLVLHLNFHWCFYNSIQTQIMFLISYFLITSAILFETCDCYRNFSCPYHGFVLVWNFPSLNSSLAWYSSLKFKNLTQEGNQTHHRWFSGRFS